MVFSKRERYLVIGLGGAVVLLVLNWLVLSPLLQWSQELSQAEQDSREKDEQIEQLRYRRHVLQSDWKKLLAAGLKSDQAESANQLEHALLQWAQESAVPIISLRPERTAEAKGLTQAGFELSGYGSSACIGRLLWHLETASMPVRIEEVNISSHNEGADDLKVQLKVSTLYISTPKPGATNSPAAPRPSGEEL